MIYKKALPIATTKSNAFCSIIKCQAYNVLDSDTAHAILMAMKRILGVGTSYYHVVSRVVDRTFRFGMVERNRFRDMMWRVAEFSGIKIMTYSVMSNHFHILIELPDKEQVDVSDTELLRRLGLIYNKHYVECVARELDRCRQEGDEDMERALRNKYLYRMHDLSEFMKTLKQRFSIWYNRTHNRTGTLWEERFKSVLVQSPDDGDREYGRRVLLTMAAYIELNAVRAGLVDDPKEYSWCGFGEAVAGIRRAQAGVDLLMGMVGMPWQKVLAKYQVYVFCKAGQNGLSRAQILRVLDAKGELSIADLLRCRVRYFSDGLVVGNRSFVDDVFERHREAFGSKRRTGARKMRWGQWKGMCVVRDLRVNVIG